MLEGPVDVLLGGLDKIENASTVTPGEATDKANEKIDEIEAERGVVIRKYKRSRKELTNL